VTGWTRRGLCVVVGAGVTGLFAARALQSAGLPVVVLDKGRVAGGRLGSREVGPGLADHGVQHLRAASALFAAQLEAWHAAGLVAPWGDTFQDAAHGQLRGGPFYRAADGMRGLASVLVAGLDVRHGLVTGFAPTPGGAWQVTSDGPPLEAGALLLTPPLPQALALCDASGIALPPEQAAGLRAVEYERCLTVLARLDVPTRLPKPGALAGDGKPLAWAADNRRKGVSPEATTVTLQAGPEFSITRWERDDESVARALFDAASAWVRGEPHDVQVKRWRYARPVTTAPAPCAVVSADPPLLLAGDGFGGREVEGAALSGLAAAERLVQGV
jgi:renalase